jgi:hypothetical protein
MKPFNTTLRVGQFSYRKRRFGPESGSGTNTLRSCSALDRGARRGSLRAESDTAGRSRYMLWKTACRPAYIAGFEPMICLVDA